MADVSVTPREIAALEHARNALVAAMDWKNAFVVEELLVRCDRARFEEVSTALVDELNERRGRLRVVNGSD